MKDTFDFSCNVTLIRTNTKFLWIYEEFHIKLQFIEFVCFGLYITSNFRSASILWKQIYGYKTHIGTCKNTYSIWKLIESLKGNLKKLTNIKFQELELESVAENCETKWMSTWLTHSCWKFIVDYIRIWLCISRVR